MRYSLITVISMALILGGVNAFAQDASITDDAGPREAVMVSGTFHHVQTELEQLVVNDQNYSLGATVWVDGQKHRTDNLMSILEEGETVTLQFSGERRDGYPVVNRIQTQP